MATSFFRRIGGHFSRFISQQQDGNLATGGGISAALLVYCLQLAGIPLPMEAAVAIIVAVQGVIGAGKRHQ